MGIVDLQFGILLALTAIIAGAFVFYQRRLRRFEAQYAELERKIPNTPVSDSGVVGTTSLGEVYALASRGPTYAFDAELKSAEMRWRHIIAAFPQLNAFEEVSHRKILLIPALYTKIPAVHAMQNFVAQRIKHAFGDQVVPVDWVSDLKEDFDALKYPQLAIANPSFYTLPFFLTWQRRHLWGVLPYAIHSRLGVILRRDHPKITLLEEFQREYEKRLSRDSAYGLWVHDPSLAQWLTILLKAVGERPAKLDRTNPDFRAQHKSPMVFAVGAYLLQELLPLACAVLGSSETAAHLAAKAQRIEPSELPKIVPVESLKILVDSSYTNLIPISAADTNTAAQDNPAWPQTSAIIVDLALCQEPDRQSNLILLRLPHCVYVPIGIGYSVLTWPLLGRTPHARKAAAELLVYSAQFLIDAQKDLSRIGIELDRRLWQHLDRHDIPGTA